MTKGQALTAVVLVHLAISLVHGRAHAGGQVPLSAAASVFVYVVILAGPLVGLVVARRQPRAGALIVGISMAAALLFGLVNHFIINGSDHVSQVAAEWRTLFAVTAALLVVSEGAGTAVAIWAGRSSNSELKVGVQTRS